MEEHIALEISLIESSGPLRQVRAPRLFFWLHAIQAEEAFRDGQAMALLRSRDGSSWVERSVSVSQDEVRDIVQLLKDLAILDRELSVKGAFDSSDVWSKLSFSVALNDMDYTLDVNMAATGFEGEDAEPLRKMLRRLLGLVGEDAVNASVCL